MSENRLSFYKDAEQFYVVIRTQKNIWLIITILLYFGLKVPHQLYRFNDILGKEKILANPDSPLIPLVILMAVLLAASIAIAAVWLLWSLFGKEVAEIDPGHAQLKIHFWLGRRWLTRSYKLSQIKNIQADILHNPVSSVLKGGNIRFDYEGKTRRFGWTLGKKDAEEICAELKHFVPEHVVQLIR